MFGVEIDEETLFQTRGGRSEYSKDEEGNEALIEVERLEQVDDEIIAINHQNRVLD